MANRFLTGVSGRGLTQIFNAHAGLLPKEQTPNFMNQLNPSTFVSRTKRRQDERKGAKLKKIKSIPKSLDNFIGIVNVILKRQGYSTSPHDGTLKKMYEAGTAPEDAAQEFVDSWNDPKDWRV